MEPAKRIETGAKLAKDGAVNTVPLGAMVLGAGLITWGLLARYNAYRRQRGRSELKVDTSVLLTASVLGLLFFGVLGAGTLAYEHFIGKPKSPSAALPSPAEGASVQRPEDAAEKAA